jgi:ClpA/ClpB-like protein
VTQERDFKRLVRARMRRTGESYTTARAQLRRRGLPPSPAVEGGPVMYPFERFTEHAKKVLSLAQEEAYNLGHGHIGTEHLLLGLLQEGEGLGARALAALGVTIEAVRPLVEEVVPPAPDEERPPRQIIPTTRTKKIIDLSFQTAQQQGQKSVGTEHLLLALVTEGEGLGAIVLRNLGADKETVRRAVQALQAQAAEEPSRERADEPTREITLRSAYDQELTDLLQRAADIAGLEGLAAAGPSHMILAMAAPDSSVAMFIKDPDSKPAHIARALRDLAVQKVEAITAGDYETAARHRAEESASGRSSTRH